MQRDLEMPVPRRQRILRPVYVAGPGAILPSILHPVRERIALSFEAFFCVSVCIDLRMKALARPSEHWCRHGAIVLAPQTPAQHRNALEIGRGQHGAIGWKKHLRLDRAGGRQNVQILLSYGFPRIQAQRIDLLYIAF